MGRSTLGRSSLKNRFAVFCTVFWGEGGKWFIPGSVFASHVGISICEQWHWIFTLSFQDYMLSGRCFCWMSRGRCTIRLQPRRPGFKAREFWCWGGGEFRGQLCKVCSGCSLLFEYWYNRHIQANEKDCCFGELQCDATPSGGRYSRNKLTYSILGTSSILWFGLENLCMIPPNLSDKLNEKRFKLPFRWKWSLQLILLVFDFY